MCGIVGYIGNNDATSFLLQGLKRLEYRGYDSAGIAVNVGDEIKIIKSAGRIDSFIDKVSKDEPKGCAGMGHSRWATHGRPSDVNAHPHSDCTGNLAVIHNGIIENYLEIKTMLKEEGHVFKSETDTEVVAHLLEKYYEKDLKAAVFKIIDIIKGSYSLVFMSKFEPDRIIAIRKHSPMIIGLGEGENYIASDIPALLGYTKNVCTLEDGDLIELTKDSVTIYDETQTIVKRNIMEINWNVEAAEKNGYDHFMIKEIHEQPEAIKRTIFDRIAESENSFSVKLDCLMGQDDYLKKINKIAIIACGTASYAGEVAKFALEKYTRIPTVVDLASEFRYRDPIVDENTLAIVISQSGETADTLAGLKEAKRRGAKVLSITNVVDSSVARESDFVLYTLAGPEIAVASTKAYMTQLVALYLVTIYLANVRKTISVDINNELLLGIKELPLKIDSFFSDYEQDIRKIAERLSDSPSVFFMGRGMDYSSSLEGALKLKEISYIHSEAYAAGELKHGSIALISDDTPVIAIMTQSGLLGKTLSNVLEVKARGAWVLAVCFDGKNDIESSVDALIKIPSIYESLAPMLSIVPLQLLSYYVAVSRGTDVDKPRNLAKSVTVE